MAEGSAGQEDEQGGAGEPEDVDVVVDDLDYDSEDYFDEASDYGTEDAAYDYEDSNAGAETIDEDYNLTPDVIEETTFEEASVTEDYPETEAPIETTAEDVEEGFDYADDYSIEAEVPLDLPLDEEAVDEEEEEDEEVDLNIDQGFLEDSQGNSVELPTIQTRTGLPSSNVQAGGNTFIFFFCALGGTNNQGAVNVVDLINTGLGNSATNLNIAALPSQVSYHV